MPIPNQHAFQLLNSGYDDVPSVLSEQQARKAARYNAKRARRIGWSHHWSGVCRVLKISNGLLQADDFSQFVAQFQMTRKLNPDGMLGEDTWRQMQAEARVVIRNLPPPPWLPVSAPGRSPIKAIAVEALNLNAPWMDVALRERETNWLNDDGSAVVEGDTRVDEGYFEACPYMGKRAWERKKSHERDLENDHWCSAFVNFCLHTAGYSHTGSTGAFSFLHRRRWRFQALDEPKRGCVIVMKHNKKKWHHVAFLDEVGDLPSNPKGDINSKKYDGYTILGGNQGGNSVNSKEFYNWTFYDAKDQYGNRSPYLYPLRGTEDANCNVELPTAAPHFCGEQWQ
ncbi:hypothetical protein ABVF61_20665 [Roseibium sp. HPY-6]|uniref:hypothetical protein n=1 Tax=Roseibium sp. HPY-6 TaxID=3229852 RepID=UPI00339069C5